MPKKMKGKEWYSMIAPKMFNEKVIGETPVSDVKALIGRTIQVNLMNLIDDLSKYYIKMYFKISDIKEKNAYTEFAGLECMRDYISRLIRYGIKRMDTIQDLITEDKKKIRVKTIIITSKKIKKNVAMSLKKLVEDMVKKEVTSVNLDELVEKIINDNIKRSIFDEGSRIYPIRAFEIRKVETFSK
jgi:small subunit ribosomal protein S3Ae